MNEKRLQIAFEIAALAALSGLAGMFLYELRLLARDLRLDVNQTAAELHTTFVTVNQAAEQARQASVQANLAAAEQRAYWNKTSLETYKTMASLRLTIVRTNESFNDVLVPKLSAALDGTTKLSATVAEDLTHTMNELQPTFDSFAKASAAAAETMADPRIGEAIGRLDETSAHAAELADETAKTAEHLEATAADIQAFVHRETTPVRGTWNVIKMFLRDFAGPVAQVATSAK